MLELMVLYYDGSDFKYETAKTTLRSDFEFIKGSKGAKIRNRYNQVPYLTQDTNWK